MTDDTAKNEAQEKADATNEQPVFEDLRLANLRQHLGYIIANVAGVLLLFLTAVAYAFDKTLEQTYNIPLYVTPMALLMEIGLLLIIAYAQHTYSKRFRLVILISGIITVFEAGILFYYANPNLL